MKKQLLTLGVIIGSALPCSVSAQQYLPEAFSAFVDNIDIAVVPQLTLERNPETGRKTSECDIYAFTLPASSRSALDDVLAAFDRDSEQAYDVASSQAQVMPVPDYKTFSKEAKKYVKAYKRAKKRSPQPGFVQTRRVRIGVGDGTAGGVDIGEQGRQYVYACFTDKQDTTNTYRYAYAVEWGEDDGIISGRLVKTYAVRADKRKKTFSGVDFDNVRNISEYVSNVLRDVDFSGLDSLVRLKPGNGDFKHFGVHVVGKDDAAGWLSKFNLYKNKYLESPTSSSASFYATSIYELCKRVDCLSPTEKALVREQLKKLFDCTEDDFILTLFMEAIGNLKE